MKKLFHPVTQQVALADLAELPRRIRAKTYTTRSGTEGRNLREQAHQQLRWHQLFHMMNRRAQA